MHVVWALVKKEFRLMGRDRVAAALLLAMPLLFILLLGLLLGESFGQKPDDNLRITLVDLDEGKGLDGKSWSHWVRQDMAETPGVNIEIIKDRATAEQLIRDHKRAAILVLDENFSDRINLCSFLDTPDGLNPFHREGVYLSRVGTTFLRDPAQLSAAAIIEQVVQVTMLRVILPFMIGKAFERMSDPEFIQILGKEVNLPVPKRLRIPMALMTGKPARDRVTLQEMLDLAAGPDKKTGEEYRKKVGLGVQAALRQQFRKYNLTGKTWAALTKAQVSDGPGAKVSDFEDRNGSGLLRRGAQRYQVLVPAYTVLFAFFLVLTVGWVFVAERRQGTLQRLRTTPTTRGQILLGKLIPCFVVSFGQGVFLLTAGRLLFGMRWGPEHWTISQQTGWLLLVAACTSLAAMGLALLVAAVARSEVQVAIYGAVPVLVLALIGGCILPREMMPEQTQKLSAFTPQGWALDAYRELLNNTGGYEPNLQIVVHACLVLTAFGVGFLGLAWGLLRWE
jgi:ABC-type multidrug transport system permease subunit